MTANGVIENQCEVDVESQCIVDDERDVSSKQWCSARANSLKTSAKPEEQPLVTLTDVKSTSLYISLYCL